MLEQGIECNDEIVPDGQIHRFKVGNDRDGKKMAATNFIMINIRWIHMDAINVTPAKHFIRLWLAQTSPPGLMKNVQKVYPHWRGELGGTAFPHLATCGLSPLARGTRETS